MNNNNYHREIIVSPKPVNVFVALTQEMAKWWGPAEGIAIERGDIITVRFEQTFWTLRTNSLELPHLIEFECITANHVHEGFSDSVRLEWLGTKLKWNIGEQGGKTKISFTHEGLIPSLGCYEICEAGWDYFFIESLQKYLETGSGTPFVPA